MLSVHLGSGGHHVASLGLPISTIGGHHRNRQVREIVGHIVPEDMPPCAPDMNGETSPTCEPDLLM